MLTEEQIEQYYREGYVVVPALADRDAVEAVLTAARRYAPGAGSTDGSTDSTDWQARVFAHERPEADADLHQLLWDERVVAAAQDLLGCGEPRVYYGMLAVVPARGGNGLPWHQDNQYTQLLGGALNVFVALSEVTPDKAQLWVAPGSHRLGTQPSRDSDLYGRAHREAAVAPQNPLLLPTLKPGDACIFDRNTYHRSLKNETDEDRYAYAAQFQADHARRAADGRKDPLRMRARELRRRLSAPAPTPAAG